MKTSIITSILITALLFAGCASNDTAKPDDTAEKSRAETEDRTEISEIPEDDGIYVTSIIDRTVTENIPTDDALEGFHADEEYVYYFPSIKSHYVTVEYSDQSERPLKEAFFRGDITVAELDRFGIEYGRQSHAENGDASAKRIIYDIICDYEEAESDTEEVFYENSDYIYSFPNPLSDYITVRYTDGSEDNIKNAFERGNITPHDLIVAGIPVWEESKVDGSAVFYHNGEVYYHEA
ncbi:MAG: hypothetical protein IJC50_00780 [Clostridia bacterium]|nr:hypothetical protein [Clostridia bacterium]